MNTLSQDVRYGARMLAKKPGFTVVAIVTLALGVGANTAIFSLVNAVLLKPLPFAEPERLVMVWENAAAVGFPQSEAAPGNFADWRAEQSSFDGLAALNWQSFDLTGDGEPLKVSAYGVTANLFPLLGVQPALGRGFSADEERPGAAKVTVLSYGLWQRRYGGGSAVVGRDIQLDGDKYTVVGVMPAGFQFMQSYIGLWVPAQFTAQELADHDNHYLTVVGRLKSGVTMERAQADLAAICERIAREHPDDAKGLATAIMPLREHLAGKVRGPLIVLLVAVGFVLLIACANIAGLLLARAASRQKEIALRTALGASRSRVVRQLLTESILLAGAGGALGLLVAMWSFALLKQLIPPGLTLTASLQVDLPALGYTMAVSLVTGVVFGLVPALQASKVDLNQALKQGGSRAGLTAVGGRLRSAFVVAEVALALVLLVVAGLLIRTVYNLRGQYSVFQPEKLLTMRTALAGYKYGEHYKRVAFYDDVLERVRALPGVVGADYTTSVPLSWKGGANGFIVEGRPRQPGDSSNAIHRQVSAGYFQTLGVALKQGRYFDDGDNQNALRVAIVNETMAAQYWPGEDAVGKRFKFGTPKAPWVTIVGVVADVRQMGMDAPVMAEMYFPYRQITSHPWYAPRDLVVRTEGDPMSIVSAVRQEIRAVDADQPVANVITMEDLLTEETGSRRLGMILLSVYAGLALLLASLGIYGVLSYFVTQQTPEIGVRMALGARQGDILRLVLGKGMVMTALGITVGLVATFALTRLMASLLFGVSASDPLTFALIALLLAAVAFLACFIPAWRATRVDPMVALRYE